MDVEGKKENYNHFAIDENHICIFNSNYEIKVKHEKLKSNNIFSYFFFWHCLCLFVFLNNCMRVQSDGGNYLNFWNKLFIISFQIGQILQAYKRRSSKKLFIDSYFLLPTRKILLLFLLWNRRCSLIHGHFVLLCYNFCCRIVDS